MRMRSTALLAIALLALGPQVSVAADLKAGALAFSRGDLPVAVRELRPLAEGGDALSQYMLGVALANAKPPLLNVSEGEGWLVKSAAQGNVAAMRSLGQLNMFGRSSPDRAQAEKWLQAAADRGDSEAQHLLGVLFLDAKGAARRPAEAYKWLLLAAQRGHLLSGVMLRTPPDQFSAADRQEGERAAAAWAPVR